MTKQKLNYKKMLACENVIFSSYDWGQKVKELYQEGKIKLKHFQPFLGAPNKADLMQDTIWQNFDDGVEIILSVKAMKSIILQVNMHQCETITGTRTQLKWVAVFSNISAEILMMFEHHISLEFEAISAEIDEDQQEQLRKERIKDIQEQLLKAVDNV